jgi:1,4-alpha-glucan branching enzyme
LPSIHPTVPFDDGQAGEQVLWGVRLDGPAGPNAWGIMPDVQQRQLELQLPGPGASAEARYYLSWSRRLGAQKHHTDGVTAPDLRFSVWAPTP